MWRPAPTLTLAALVAWSAPSAAQEREAREPGSLEKAYQALVGDGTEEQRVDRPPVERERIEDPLPAFRPEPGKWFFDADAYAETYGVFDPDRPDEFHVRRSGARFGATRIGERGQALGAELTFEGTSLDFDDLSTIAPGVVVPVQDLFLGRFTGFWRGDQSQTWGYTAGFSLEAAGEAEAEFADALTVQAFGAATYRIDRDLALTFGVLARTALEDDPLVVPVVGLEWSISERQRLLTRGPSLSYEYDIDDRRSVFSTLALQTREYRLDGVGPLPGSALSDREVRLIAGFEWRPGLHEPLGIADSVARFYAGSTLYQELVWRDGGDEPLLGLYQEPTFLIGAELSLTF